MDLRVQKKMMWFYKFCISIFGFIGFVVGYVRQEMVMFLYITTAGYLLSVVVCVPNWPFYRKNDLIWQTGSIEKQKQKPKRKKK
ncbi:Signal peptidase complex subunit 1 [Bonamia ostreae]|uniref:Signal peptidase complex subunit 1 n=1 Tax=Bonamia ostreae TaxID=126728 RepID=A0ABV2AR37_9EUKA